MSDYEVKVESAKPENTDPEWLRRVEKIADSLDARLGVRFWTLTGLIVASLLVGSPHLLIQYKSYGQCGPHATEFNCQYFGVRGWKVTEPEQGKCPRMRLL